MRAPRYKLKKPQENEEKPIEQPKEIDVANILKENLKKHQKHEKPINLENVKKRKRTDYILCMSLGNLAIVLPYFILNQNFVTEVFTLSGIVIFSTGFTWIMWQIVGDY